MFERDSSAAHSSRAGILALTKYNVVIPDNSGGSGIRTHEVFWAKAFQERFEAFRCSPSFTKIRFDQYP
jgi:hypothetical protein